MIAHRRLVGLLRLGFLGLGTLCLGLSVTGCGQFEPRGAGDACSPQSVFGAEKVRECRANQAAVLVPERDAADRTAGGLLDGAPLPLGPETTDSDGRPLLHALVLDYSGSMFRRCTDAGDSGQRQYLWSHPGFASLLRDGLLSGVGERDPVHTLVFNRQVIALDGTALDDASGPHSFDPATNAFDGGLPIAPRGAAAALKRLTAPELHGTLPADPFRAGFGDARETRLDHVLPALRVLFESYEARDGVAWVVTDNIIETGDGREPELNRRFYRILESDPRWQVVYAWPLHRAPAGGDAWLCDQTLMVYGLYYSSRERLDERTYQQLTGPQNPGARLGTSAHQAIFETFADPQSPSPGEPFKLKPAYMDVVRLAFASEVRCPPARVGQPRQCRADLEIENLLPHRTVESLRLVLHNSRTDAYGQLPGQQVRRLHTAVPLCAGSVRAEKLLEEPLAPGERRTLPIVLDVGPVTTERHTLADYWENAQHEYFAMFGAMHVDIYDLETAMVIEDAQLGSVYGVEAMPAIFRNPSTDELATSICLQMGVHNPTQTASLLLLLLLLLAVLLFLAITWWLRPVYRQLHIDGSERGRVRLVRWRWSDLQTDGRSIARAKLGLGGRPRVTGASGFTVRSVGGHAWESTERDGLGTSYQLELLPLRRRQADRRHDEF